MLELILGRSASGKTTQILRRMCSRGTEGTRRQILLVPEQQSHEMERRLCREGGNRTCLYAEVLTFSRLASRLLQSAGGAGHPELDGGGRVLLMYQVLRELSGQLSVYHKPSQRASGLNSLLATVDELKSSCVTPEQLAAAGGQLEGVMGEKLRDVALIYAAYDAKTRQIALDTRDRLDRAWAVLDDPRCAWLREADLYLDGFVDFTAQEERILCKLLDWGGSVTAAFTCDHPEEDEDGAGIFSPARRTIYRLQRASGKGGCRMEILQGCPGVRSQAMLAVERQLFDPLDEQPAPCGEDVRLFAAADPRAEVEWTAARIRALVREQGLRYRDIGVAARNYAAYDDLVAAVFRQYDIPVFRAASSDILQKPVLTLVTAALDIVGGNYEYDDVFRYLKTDLTDLSREERDLLENYVLKWDLRGSRWLQEQPWTMHPQGYGYSVEEADRQLLERIDLLRHRVTGPLKRLQENKDKSGRGRAMALYRFLEDIGLEERLQERMERLRREGELNLAEEYRQLWEILCGGLEQCAELLDGGDLEADEFARLFRLVLSQYGVNTIPVSLDRVSAGEMARQGGHGLKVLFLLGADDGSLPQVSAPAGVLTEEDRIALEEFDISLGETGTDQLCREMNAIYTACTHPEQQLFVTWPARSSGGEELRPSFLVERLRKLFPDLKTEQDPDGLCRLAAPRPALRHAATLPLVGQVLKELPRWNDAVERVERATRWERGRLSRQAVERLYGQRVPMSASRMDKYKSCHFSYFMQYGLKAQPRKSAGFSAPEYGTFVHYVLEHVFCQDDWRTEEGGVDTDRLKELTRRAVERYVQEELGGLEHQTARFRYLFQRLLGGVDQVVDNVAQELAASQFRPVDFELGFGRNKDLPPVELTEAGVSISMTGFVDRVDGWEKDGKLYLRVVDYKTGRKSFDLTEVWNGMGLQMLLYLFALREKGPDRYGKEIVPAGVLYLPAREVTIAGSRSMSKEEQRSLVDKQLRRQGLVLDDPAVLNAMEKQGEEGIRFLPLKQYRDGRLGGDGLVSARRLERLERHVQRVLRDICRELASGNICADPFWRGSEKNACRFCDYAAACHFEEGRGGDCRRWLHHVGTEEFWQNVEKDETGEETNETGHEEYSHHQ